MVYTLTFKMPDVLDQIDEQVDNEEDREIAKVVARKFVSYDEYATIEIDTETGTAAVKES